MTRQPRRSPQASHTSLDEIFLSRLTLFVSVSVTTDHVANERDLRIFA